MQPPAKCWVTGQSCPKLVLRRGMCLPCREYQDWDKAGRPRADEWHRQGVYVPVGERRTK